MKKFRYSLYENLLSIITYCFFIIFLSGCNNDPRNPDINEIPVGKRIHNFKPIRISDCRGELRYVRLESNSPLLKAAALAAFSDQYFLVSDRTLCLLYKTDGRFVAKIGRIGKGPGEYTSVRKFQFDNENNIYINDGNNLSVFNPNGEFLYRFNARINSQDGFDSSISTFALVDDSTFIGQIRDDSGKEKYRAVFFDLNGNTIKFVNNYFFLNKMSRHSFSGNGEANIFKEGDDVVYKEYKCDTVFKISDRFRLNPKYIINLGVYHMPREVWELPSSEFYDKLNDYIGIRYFLEVHDYVFLECAFGKYNPAEKFDKSLISGTWPYWAFLVTGVYNKTTRELAFAEFNPSGSYMTLGGLANDYDGGINFYPKFQVNDSTLAMEADVYLLKEHIKSREFKQSTPKYPEEKKELEAFVNNLSENDNPVLILCTFKKQS